MYKTVDLFAGAGGLSLGFAQTGKFRIVLAAENNPYAAQTYRRNHDGTDVTDDVRKINYAEVIRKYGDIDVVIGGPPCQGFSNANRQRAILSANNGLVKEYVRAIVELKPKVFLMENVSALKSEIHRFYVAEGEDAMVDELGLSIRRDQIELCPNLFEFIPLRDDITKALDTYEKYLWNDSFFKAVKIISKKRSNPIKVQSALDRYKSALMKYSLFDGHCLPDDKIGAEYKKLYEFICDYYMHDEKSSVTDMGQQFEICYRLQELFRRFDELKQNKIQISSISWDKGLCVDVRSYSVLDYIKCRFTKEKLPYKFSLGILNAVQFGAPQKRERFIMLGSRIGEKPTLPDPIITDEKEYRTVKDAIGDLEQLSPTIECLSDGIQNPFAEAQQNSPLSFLRDSKLIYNHFRTNTGKTAQDRFDALSQGQNFHDLPDELKSTYSNGDRTQSTVYMKLKYDEPSGTVLNVRKSMWVHPVINRALSAREAARLQTFPDSFVFEGPKNAQYQQIGNAVPPVLANVVAKKIADYLDSHVAKLHVDDKVLYKLALNPYEKQADMAKEIGVTPSYISMTIKKLYAQGLVEDVRDGRKTGWKVLASPERE